MRINRSRLIAGMCAIAGATLFAQGRNVGNEWPTSLGDWGGEDLRLSSYVIRCITAHVHVHEARRRSGAASLL
jgi:hypothetical protein